MSERAGEAGPAGVLVVGIGNELLRDEGLGIHVARALAAASGALPDSVEVIEGGLALLDLAPEMARRERVILVDAVRAGGVPGTVYRIDLEDGFGADLPTEASLSLHQWGLADTLRAIALMGLLPRHLTVIGAEPAVVEPGLDLSPAVAGAALRMVAQLLAELGAPAGTSPAGGRVPLLPSARM
jgi:hydrogenase maturation protease